MLIYNSFMFNSLAVLSIVQGSVFRATGEFAFMSLDERIVAACRNSTDECMGGGRWSVQHSGHSLPVTICQLVQS